MWFSYSTAELKRNTSAFNRKRFGFSFYQFLSVYLKSRPPFKLWVFFPEGHSFLPSFFSSASSIISLSPTISIFRKSRVCAIRNGKVVLTMPHILKDLIFILSMGVGDIIFPFESLDSNGENNIFAPNILH